MKSRINIRTDKTFLNTKNGPSSGKIASCKLLYTALFTVLLKILQNCTFRINLHELHEHRRRSGRVVECTGLENRRTLTRTVGSNPTSSAIIKENNILKQLLIVFH